PRQPPATVVRAAVAGRRRRPRRAVPAGGDAARPGARMTALLDVDATIDTARILVCCGSGGVGKTTTAAALALRAAERGRRTVVLTIDPARRLAQALGMEALGNEPGRVAAARGDLHAMMLDMRRTFDEMVYAH